MDEQEKEQPSNTVRNETRSARPSVVSDWELVECVESGGYIAKIKRRPLFRGAYSYSIQIGFAESSLPGTFRLMFDKESLNLTSTAVTLVEDVAAVVSELLTRIQARVLKLAEEDLAWRQNEAFVRDEKKASFGKPVTKVTGKTEKKKQRLMAKKAAQP